jgi:hypothetical protein
MRITIVFFIGLLLFSCKKKEDSKPGIPGTTSGGTTTGGGTVHQGPKVNGHIMTYKTYSYNIVGVDTFYSKYYYVIGRMFKTALDVKTTYDIDEYDGTLTCNADSLTYYDGSSYTSFGLTINWPFNWNFTNSSSFGTNNITISDSCLNLRAHDYYLIPDTVSISQDFSINLNSSVSAFNTAMLSYQNSGNGNAGFKYIYTGQSSLTIPANELSSYGPDSMYVALSLSTDNYKVINGKNVLFENIGVISKYIKFKP